MPRFRVVYAVRREETVGAPGPVEACDLVFSRNPDSEILDVVEETDPLPPGWEPGQYPLLREVGYSVPRDGPSLTESIPEEEIP